MIRLAWLVPFFLACGPAPSARSPEAELTDVVEKMVESIEAGDPQRVLDHVAYDFREDGGLTYPDVQSTLLTFLIQEKPVHAELEELSIIAPPREGDPHRVQARLRFARGSQDGSEEPMPAESVRYSFDLAFIHGENGWQATGGRYKRL